MPKLTLHPLSVVIGLALAGLVVLTTSQASPPPAALNPAAVRIEYMPHPRDMVQVREEVGPYTVPAGKIFVLTGLGDTEGCGFAARILVNGIVEALGGFVNGPGVSEFHSVQPFQAGFSVPAGSVITVVASCSGAKGRAWGYLASQ